MIRQADMWFVFRLLHMANLVRDMRGKPKEVGSATSLGEADPKEVDTIFRHSS